MTGRREEPSEEIRDHSRILRRSTHRILDFEGLTVVFFCGVRCLTRSLPKGSAATEAKAEWCNVLQLLRLEVRYHSYSGFSGGVDHTPAPQAGLVREPSN